MRGIAQKIHRLETFAEGRVFAHRNLHYYEIAAGGETVARVYLTPDGIPTSATINHRRYGRALSRVVHHTRRGIDRLGVPVHNVDGSGWV